MITRRGFLARVGAVFVAGRSGLSRPVVPALAFHPQAFEMAGEGLSMRFVRQYDISTDRMPMRLDVLYGVGIMRPEFACRILDAHVEVEAA